MSSLQQSINSAVESPTRRNATWLFFQGLLWPIFAWWLRQRVSGVERIPTTGGGLFVINHQSFLDPLLVGMPLRRPVSYLARDSLFRVPVIGWILRSTYVKPINREAASTAAIRQIIHQLEAGFLCGIFPEGTRSPDGTVGEFKPGFVSLVRRVKVPIYPIGVAGGHQALGKGAWFLKPCRVRVVFGAPIPESLITPLREKGREDELVRVVREYVVAAQKKAEEWRIQGRLPEEKDASPTPSQVPQSEPFTDATKPASTEADHE